MRREIGYSPRADWPFYAVAAAFVGAAVYLAFLAHFASAALLIVVAGLVTYLIGLLRRRNAPFLILEETGLTCPARRLRIAWADVKRTYLLYPPKGDGGRPSLALELAHEPEPGAAHRPRFSRPDSDLPGVYVDLPALDTPVEELMRQIGAFAPGRVAPPEHYEPPPAD